MVDHDHRLGEQFKSVKKPKLMPDGTLEPDKIILSFRDPAAQKALRVLAIWTKDEGLGRDIDWRLDSIE